jgi:hypothetical protein
MQELAPNKFEAIGLAVTVSFACELSNESK